MPDTFQFQSDPIADTPFLKAGPHLSGEEGVSLGDQQRIDQAVKGQLPHPEPVWGPAIEGFMKGYGSQPLAGYDPSDEVSKMYAHWTGPLSPFAAIGRSFYAGLDAVMRGTSGAFEAGTAAMHQAGVNFGLQWGMSPTSADALGRDLALEFQRRSLEGAVPQVGPGVSGPGAISDFLKKAEETKPPPPPSRVGALAGFARAVEYPALPPPTKPTLHEGPTESSPPLSPQGGGTVTGKMPGGSVVNYAYHPDGTASHVDVYTANGTLVNTLRPDQAAFPPAPKAPEISPVSGKPIAHDGPLDYSTDSNNPDISYLTGEGHDGGFIVYEFKEGNPNSITTFTENGALDKHLDTGQWDFPAWPATVTPEPVFKDLHEQHSIIAPPVGRPVEAVASNVHAPLRLMTADAKNNNYKEEQVSLAVNHAIKELSAPGGFQKTLDEHLSTAPNPDVAKAHLSQTLKTYADESAKLPVYNEAQWHAREAQVAIGNMKWNEALGHMNALKDMIDHGEYNTIAGVAEKKFSPPVATPAPEPVPLSPLPEPATVTVQDTITPTPYAHYKNLDPNKTTHELAGPSVMGPISGNEQSVSWPVKSGDKWSQLTVMYNKNTTAPLHAVETAGGVATPLDVAKTNLPMHPYEQIPFQTMEPPVAAVQDWYHTQHANYKNYDSGKHEFIFDGPPQKSPGEIDWSFPVADGSVLEVQYNTKHEPVSAIHHDTAGNVNIVLPDTTNLPQMPFKPTGPKPLTIGEKVPPPDTALADKIKLPFNWHPEGGAYKGTTSSGHHIIQWKLSNGKVIDTQYHGDDYHTLWGDEHYPISTFVEKTHFPDSANLPEYPGLTPAGPKVVLQGPLTPTGGGEWHGKTPEGQSVYFFWHDDGKPGYASVYNDSGSISTYSTAHGNIDEIKWPQYPGKVNAAVEPLHQGDLTSDIGNLTYFGDKKGGDGVVYYDYNPDLSPKQALVFNKRGELTETLGPEHVPPHPSLPVSVPAPAVIKQMPDPQEYPGIKLTGLSTKGVFEQTHTWSMENGGEAVAWYMDGTDPSRPTMIEEFDPNGDFVKSHFPLPPQAQKLVPLPVPLKTLHVAGSSPIKVGGNVPGVNAVQYATPQGGKVYYYYDEANNYKPTFTNVVTSSGKISDSYTGSELNQFDIPPHPSALITLHDPLALPTVHPLAMTYKTPDGGKVIYHYDQFSDYASTSIALFDNNKFPILSVIDPDELKKYWIPDHPNKVLQQPQQYNTPATSYSSNDPTDWEYYKNLIPEHHKGLSQASKDELNNYSRSAYHVNKKLHIGAEAGQDVRTKRQERLQLNRMFMAFQEVPDGLPADMLIWIGTNKRVTDRLHAMNIGDHYDFPAYMSSSLKRTSADNFNGGDWILRTRAKKGDQAVLLGPISNIPEEHEILWNRHAILTKLAEDPVDRVIDVEVSHASPALYDYGKMGKPPVEQGNQLSLYPMKGVREYTFDGPDNEFQWEYREYTNYGTSRFPGAFSDIDDFKDQYLKAPLEHLTEQELKTMENATIGPSFNIGTHAAAAGFATHRRFDRIYDMIVNGHMPPPIVLRDGSTLRILGGNTRASTGAAMGFNLPMKVIDISKSQGH